MIPWWVYVLGFGAMGVAELIALLNKQPGDTISERTWFLTRPKRRYKGPTPWWAWVVRVVIGVPLLWLIGHLLFGLWVF